MRVARLLEPNRFSLVEEPAPTPGKGEALLRTDSVGICASDLHYFLEGGIGETRFAEPIVLGHEPMGTVLEVGEGVDPGWIGKRVAVEPGIPCFECEWCQRGDHNLCPHVRFFGSPPIDGAFREFFTHPAILLEPLPDRFSAADGALLEPLGVAIHAVDLVRPRTATPVLVVGCGTIGLCTILILRAAGVCPIHAIDPLAYRTDLALACGADKVHVGEAEETLEEVLKETRGRGFDLVFEAAGQGSAQEPSIELTAIGGKTVLIGITSKDRIEFRESRARRKGLTLYMARRSRRTLDRGVRLIESGRIDTRHLVTHRFPLSQVQTAFEVAAGYRDGILKAVIEGV
jgi:L-iditol 2-dehydrogenase